MQAVVKASNRAKKKKPAKSIQDVHGRNGYEPIEGRARSEISDKTFQAIIFGVTMGFMAIVFSYLKSDISDLKRDMSDLRREVRSDINEVKQEVRGIRQEVSGIRQEVREIRGRLEQIALHLTKGK